MSKLKIELGGKYSAGEMFKRAQADVKQFGKDTKDIGGLATSALKEIATVADKDVSTALKGMSGVISGMVTGGIFGMLAAAASTAFELIKSHIEKAKEKAQEMADAINQSIQTGFNKVKDQFGGVDSQVAKSRKEIDAFIKTAQGQHAADVKIKVAQLHVETLQKITDGMSEAGKKSIEAQEKYNAELLKQNGERLANAEAETGLNQQKIAVETSLQETTRNLATARAQMADFEKANSGELTRYNGLLDSANKTIEELVADGVNEQDAIKIHTQRLAEKTEFEEKHKAFLEQWKLVQESVKTGEETKNNLIAQQNAIDEKLTELKQNETVLRAEQEARLKELDTEARKAQEALQLETAAALDAAREDETKAQWAAYIYEKVSATEEEYLRLQEAANAAIEDGLTTEEISYALQEEWNKILKERNELVNKSNALQKEENKKREKGEADDKLPQINIGGSSVTADISNTHELGNEVGKEAKKELNLDNKLQQNRDQLRETRDVWTNVKGNSNFLWNLAENMKNKKWSKDHLDEWANEMLEYQQQHWTPGLAEFAKKELGVKDDKPLSFVDAMAKQAVKDRIGLTPTAKRQWEESIAKIKTRMEELQRDKTKVQRMYDNINTCATTLKDAVAPKK